MLPDDATDFSKILPQGCPVCGAKAFTYNKILWEELINEWQLSPKEADYINLQQGLSCTRCRNNLRSMTLARAICRSQGHEGTLDEWRTSTAGISSNILEINEAGLLTNHLTSIPGHRLIRYPDIDIHALSMLDASFDLVIHSDTLEHVANPVSALSECRRVLKQGGTLAFTVPVIVDRMTRSRTGLPPSYHGAPQAGRPDYIVETEFGADCWRFIIEAGFASITIYTDIFPASIAFVAQK